MYHYNEINGNHWSKWFGGLITQIVSLWCFFSRFIGLWSHKAMNWCYAARIPTTLDKGQVLECAFVFVNVYSNNMCICKSFGLCLRGWLLHSTSDCWQLERVLCLCVIFYSYAFYILVVYLHTSVFVCYLLVYLCISQNNGLSGRILNANCAGQDPGVRPTLGPRPKL